MFEYYVLAIMLLYFLIAYINMKTKSAVMVLMVYQNYEIVGIIPFYSKDFGRGVRNARKSEGYSLFDFAGLVEFSALELWSIEHGYKIESSEFLGFLIRSKEILEYDDGYIISPGSRLMEWCIDSCNKITLERLKEVQKDVTIISSTTVPEVVINEDLTFDEYIFKGHPMIFITTDILSVKVEKNQKEHKCWKKLIDSTLSQEPSIFGWLLSLCWHFLMNRYIQ